MLGVRLDSGDLVGLSRQARRMLDEAGLTDAVIVASNELDELQIDQLKRDGAKINVWGVGTRLATAYDQPALGGVYKLSAIETDAGSWQYKLKLSEEPIKVSNPGIHQVRRYRRGDRWLGDLIYDEPTGVQAEQAVTLGGQPLDLSLATSHQDLLVPVFRQGRVVYDSPPESVSRQHAIEQLEGLDESVKRLRDAEPYPVGMDRRLWTMKRTLMDQVEVRQS
jgi:nicotinate phosphoribosyltransferase